MLLGVTVLGVFALIGYQAVDTSPPGTPTGLKAVGVSDSQINLSWTSSTDNADIAGYTVLRNGAPIAIAASDSFPDVSVSPETSYSYAVSAFDTAGNCSEISGTASGATPARTAPSGFLRLSDDGTHLVDGAERPVFITGDAAWSLIAELTEAETVQYLSDRASRGFNAILVNLIERHFATNAPANRAGDLPFTGVPFRSPPNEAYFRHADFAIQEAQLRGITVILSPSYAGYGCSNEGWCSEIVDATNAEMYAWGQYVGNRYRSIRNIIWVIGGDVDPRQHTPLQARLDQVALGIRQADANHRLMTAHSVRGQAAMDVFEGYPWLTLNTAYERPWEMAARCAANYTRPGALPLFAFEDYYENEHAMTSFDLRREAYWAVLNGATLGRIFGNNPIWGFSYLSADWEDSLGSPGSVEAALVGSLMRSRAFWIMEPDLDHTVMTAGYESEETLAVTSRARDGRSIIAYIPTRRPVSIDMSRVSGAKALIFWFNPRTGDWLGAGWLPTRGEQTFLPPDENDWVLVIDAAAIGHNAPAGEVLEPVGVRRYP